MGRRGDPANIPDGAEIRSERHQ